MEPNFDPGHDRRLRRLLQLPGVSWGVGLPSGSAVLLGPGGAREIVGTVFGLGGPDDDLEPLVGSPLGETDTTLEPVDSPLGETDTALRPKD